MTMVIRNGMTKAELQFAGLPVPGPDVPDNATVQILAVAWDPTTGEITFQFVWNFQQHTRGTTVSAAVRDDHASAKDGGRQP